MLNPIFAITENLNRRYPEGSHPYQIMTRLLEECGELAQQVNHFESSGIKRQKYGKPNPDKMAKEVLDVVRGAFQIALYYGIEEQVIARFAEAYNAITPPPDVKTIEDS